MRLAGGIQVSRLYSVPGFLIESTNRNTFSPTVDRAVELFTEAILWTKACIGKKA